MQITVAQLTLQTGRGVLPKAIERIVEEIESNEISIELETGSLYQILEEALANAMQHGNRWNSGLIVTVSMLLDWAALYIIIADEGEGFCQLALPGRIENIEEKGIGIIRKFCSPYWNDKGNAIYLKLPLSEQKIRKYNTPVRSIHDEDKAMINDNPVFLMQNTSSDTSKA